MKYQLNHSLIEKLQDSHFGDITQKVIRDLSLGRCHGVYGLPGYGMEFFAKHIIQLMQNNYPMYGTLLINVDHNKDNLAILKKFDVENYIKSNKLLIVLAEVLSPEYESLYEYINYLKWLSKDNLSVLTVANYTLYSDYATYLETGPDIFQSISFVKPFDYKKTIEIIELNNSEYNWNIPINYAKKIYELGGGIPALTKYICMAMYEEGMDLVDNPIKLINIQPLKKRIHDLSLLVTKLNIEQLKHFGLLDEHGRLVPTLLRCYLDHEDLNGLSLVFPELTRSERRILKCFIDNINNALSKDHVALVLGQDLESYSEWAIYKAIERLKNKVANVFTIESSYGHGWVLKKVIK